LYIFVGMTPKWCKIWETMSLWAYGWVLICA